MFVFVIVGWPDARKRCKALYLAMRQSNHKHNTAYCFCGLSESAQVFGKEHVCLFDISGLGGLPIRGMWNE